MNNLIALPNFVMADESGVINALAFWQLQSPLDYADCYHLTLTAALGMSEIYTCDRKVDRYPGVKRIEP